MPISELQRAERVKRIGASDVSAILGLNPWKSAYEVWAEKRGILEPAPAGEAADDGNALESRLLDWAEPQLGPLDRNVFAELPELHIGANLDGKLKATGEPVEAKTTGINGPVYGQWGDAGTDEIPDSYILQAQCQIMVTKAPGCHVAAWLGGIGKRLYRIDANPALADIIADAAMKFWRSVESDTPPIDSKPSLDVMKRMRRQPKMIARVKPELVTTYQAASEAAKAAAEAKDKAQAALLAADPEAEAYDFGDPEFYYTYFSQSRKGYVVEPTSYRVLRKSKRPT